MFRIAQACIAAGCLICLGEGCAHFVEAQAIARFAKAMQSEDLAALKEATSSPFEEKALRRSEAVEDLKILRLYPDPKDGKKKLKTEIVKVEDVSEHEKLVTVTMGDSKTRKLQYRLARDGKNGKWVVDDVIVKQNKKDVSAAKSVTEQMDLLLSVREFLAAWEKGDRSEILAVTSPGSAKVLGELPPEQLQSLARQVAGGKQSAAKIRPEAQLDGNDAVVRLRRSADEIMITYRQTNGHWKVVDAKVERKGNKGDVGSVIKTAGVLLAVNRFMTAYRANDKPALQKTCTPNLFEKSLKIGDLKLVTLPAIQGKVENDQVRIAGPMAEFILRGPSEVVKISLSRQNVEADAETPASYLVSDVTLFDATQEKRLSAVFTSQALMEIFSEALSKRDLDRVRMTSTPDFNHRVWDTLDAARMNELRLPEVESVPPQVLSTEFRGDIIEITVQQGSRVLTYVLRDWSGRLNVDDVLMPVLERPNSLKSTLELTLPIENVLMSLRAARADVPTHAPQIEFLQINTSKDFNRSVWSQSNRVPQVGQSALAFFDAPLSAIRLSDAEALVTYGDDRLGSRVLLTKENARFVVDQITLISGPEADQRVELKGAMRMELADRGLQPLPAERPSVVARAGDPLSSEPISIDPLENPESSRSATTLNPSAEFPKYRRGHGVVPASVIRGDKSPATH